MAIKLNVILTFAILLPLVAGAQAEDASSDIQRPAPGPIKQRYSVKPSEVIVPDTASLGSYRRVIQPFKNWVLICDEDLSARKKICNISQTIIDQQGQQIFSWSLAADQDGRPFFILRFPSTTDGRQPILIDIPDKGAAASVRIKACDATVCLAYQAVGPRLRGAIDKGDTIGILYQVSSSAPVQFTAPLLGLKQALNKIE